MPLNPINLGDVITRNDAAHACAQVGQVGSCFVTEGVRNGNNGGSLYTTNFQVLDAAGMMEQLDVVQTSVNTIGVQLINAIEQNENLYAFSITTQSSTLTGVNFANSMKARRVKKRLRSFVRRWMSKMNDDISDLRSIIITYRSSVSALNSGVSFSAVNLSWLTPDAGTQASQNISKLKSISTRITSVTKQANNIMAKWDRLNANLTESLAGRLPLGDNESFDVSTIKEAYGDLMPDESILDKVVSQFADTINSSAATFTMTAPTVADMKPLDVNFTSLMAANNASVMASIYTSRDTLLATPANLDQIDGYIKYVQTYMSNLPQAAELIETLTTMKTDNLPRVYIDRMRQRATVPENQPMVIQSLTRALEILKPEDEIYRTQLEQIRETTLASMTGRS